LHVDMCHLPSLFMHAPGGTRGSHSYLYVCLITPRPTGRLTVSGEDGSPLGQFVSGSVAVLSGPPKDWCGSLSAPKG